MPWCLVSACGVCNWGPLGPRKLENLVCRRVSARNWLALDADNSRHCLGLASREREVAGDAGECTRRALWTRWSGWSSETRHAGEKSDDQRAAGIVAAHEIVTRASISRMSQPSGRCTLMVSTAPNWADRRAVCVLVNRTATVSGVGRTMLGVVSATPAAVLSVTATNHAVRSEYWLHGPSSCSEKLKSQSVPRWIVDEVWTATILPRAVFISNFAPNHSNRLLVASPPATP